MNFFGQLFEENLPGEREGDVAGRADEQNINKVESEKLQVLEQEGRLKPVNEVSEEKQTEGEKDSADEGFFLEQFQKRPPIKFGSGGIESLLDRLFFQKRRGEFGIAHKDG
jgi:hypothetical protein